MSARWSLTQLRQYSPDDLLTLSDYLKRMAPQIEDLFEDYKRKVEAAQSDGTWSGRVADAALARANQDKLAASHAAKHLGDLSAIAREGYYDISAPREQALGLINEATGNHFSVTEKLEVLFNPGPFAGAPGAPLSPVDFANFCEVMESTRAQYQADIVAESEKAATADLALSAKIGKYREFVVDQFTSASVLGGDQGGADGKDFIDHPDKLTPEQLARLKAAGHITPEALAALQSGTDIATIPAAQWEYLTAFARSLNGKSPTQIKGLLKKLPKETQEAFANGLQLISHHRVTAGVGGGKESSERGSLKSLPTQMRESLTRGDLVGQATRVPGAPNIKGTAFHGVHNNLAIADIVRAGNSQYQAGSALDHSLMDVGRQYLDQHVMLESGKLFKSGYLSIDDKGCLFPLDDPHTIRLGAPGGPTTPLSTDFAGQILGAVGDDKFAVAEAFGNKDHGADFIRDVLSHEWKDSAGVRKLFEPHHYDSAGAQHYRQDGEIMQKVASAVSTNDAWRLLHDIPGTGHQSAGQLNPVLMQTLAKGLSPYISDMAGADWVGGHGDTNGFNTNDWSPENNADYRRATNIVALMNTDTEAGKLFNAHAQAEILAHEKAHADQPNANHLQHAGEINGILDRGIQQQLKTHGLSHPVEQPSYAQHAYNALRYMPPEYFDQYRFDDNYSWLFDPETGQLLSLAESLERVGEEGHPNVEDTYDAYERLLGDRKDDYFKGYNDAWG